MRRTLLLVLTGMGLAQASWGQTKASTAPLTTAGLQVLFESPDLILPRLYQAAIEHSADITRLDASTEVARADATLANKRLLNLLAVTSSYNYGTLPYFATAETTAPVYQVNPFSLGARAQYSLGLNMVAPLDVLAGRRTAIHRQELIVDQTQAQRRTQEMTIRQQVITQYEGLSLARTLMMHYQDALSSASVSKQIADNRFKQGELTVDEQLTASGLYSRTLLAYEESRNRYQTAELLLENLIGASLTTIALAPQ